jgi:porin
MRYWRGATILALVILSGTSARADDSAEPTTPTFSGDLRSREYLLGDWLGYRQKLADRGITVDSNLSQFFQGVASGGLQQRFAYGDYFGSLIEVDGGKLGLLQGSYLTVRFEANFGSTINSDTGAFNPAALGPSLPVLNGGAAVTDFYYTQVLTEHFSVFFGKIDTLDGDENAFAAGRGIDQFLNSSLVSNPLTFLGVPYSTMGAGFIIKRGDEQIFTFTVMDPAERTQDTIFNQPFATGVTLNAELRVPVTIFGRLGHQLLGGDWSSKTFTDLRQDPRILLPMADIPIAPRIGTWNLYYNFDQYLFSDPAEPTRGWGIFGRAGYSDGNPNPIKYFLSGGIGGNSPIARREHDTFGIGYAFSAASSELGPIISRLVGNGHVAEAYYNAAVTPWFHVTTDIQVIRGGFSGADTALVLGIRAKIRF